MSEWTEDEALQLIQLYRSKEMLWDPTHPLYFKKSLKEIVWREIASELALNRGDVECKNKIVSMLSSYRREKNKMKNSLLPSSGSSRVYVTRWFAYEALQFLEERDTSRKRAYSDLLPGQTNDGITFRVKEEGLEEAEEEYEEDAEVSNVLSDVQTYNPPSSKQLKTEHQEDSVSDAMPGVWNVLEAASSSSEPPPETDEMAAFFNFVSQKTKNYSPATKIGVQHAIFDILVQADRGLYEEQ